MVAPTRANGAVRRWLPLAVILTVYVAVQAYVIGHSVIPARDGSRYLRFALRLETEPWRDVLRTEVDHPGYPVAAYTAFRLGDAVGLTPQRPVYLFSESAHDDR